MKTRYLFPCLGLLVLTNIAHAAVLDPAKPGAIVDNIVTTLGNLAQGWNANLQAASLAIFGTLVTLDAAWMFIRLMLSKARNGDVGDVAEDLIFHVMQWGLFAWLLTETTLWGPAIINGFRQAAGIANGTQTMNPGDILIVGINLAGEILDALTWWSVKSDLVLTVSGIIVLCCFAFIVSEVVEALIEAIWVSGTACLFMSFGGSRFSRDKAMNVINHMIGLGVRIFFLQILAGAGATLGRTWVNEVGAMDGKEVLAILACSLLLGRLTARLPGRMEGVIAGSGGGHGLFGPNAAAGAVMVGGAVMAQQVATAMVGMGAMAGSAARLAHTQIGASGTQPQGLARAAAMMKGTIGNVASGMSTDVGRGLSGQRNGAGSMPWRVSADLANRNRLLGEDMGTPRPPPSGNTIGTNP